jgi:hypothetical protein
MHPIGGLLGFAGCSEDRARVILEKAQPRCHVRSVVEPRMMGDTESASMKETVNSAVASSMASQSRRNRSWKFLSNRCFAPVAWAAS